LCLSGCAGLVLGDVGYFHALALIGPRLCSLIMATWPAIATTIVAARDGVPPPGLVAGMLLSVTGVTVVLLRSRDGSAWRPGLTRRQWWIGVGGALLGAVGQAVGVVLAQQGMARTADLPEGVDPLATTLVRMATGAAGVQLLAVLQRRPLALLEVPRHRGALAATLAGMLFGPVLGVWASMAATQLAPLPVASALMATTPIFMLPVAKFAYGARIGWLGAGGTVLTVLGVAVLLLVG
ncbi:MAG: hypothetical protein FJ265_18740, partial [Planctomycetes bacterium]|nr:hypothetical protein [Planctomycetota bacterium]